MQGRMVPRLIGFASEAELEFFDLFCTVDKVGTRKAIKAPIDHDKPASSEPSVNAASETSQSSLAPSRWLAQPVSGITLAKASR